MTDYGPTAIAKRRPGVWTVSRDRGNLLGPGWCRRCAEQHGNGTRIGETLECGRLVYECEHGRTVIADGVKR